MACSEKNDVKDEVGSIIDQIKNQNRQLKKEIKTTTLDKENLETFILDNAASLVKDSIEMIQTIKEDVMAGADFKLVESTAELVKATTTAIDALNKIKLSDDKIKGQKEIKQMEIDSKKESESSQSKGMYISREELLNALLAPPPKKIEKKPIEAIDV